MKNKRRSYLKILGPAGWDKGRVLIKVLCLCGKNKLVGTHRLKEYRGSCFNRMYKSCGCLRDSSSHTFWISRRWQFFDRIKKVDDHWIYTTNSKSTIVKCTIKGTQVSIQRVAYQYWHHIDKLNGNCLVDNICSHPHCVKPTHLRLLSYSDKNKLNWSKKREKYIKL